MYHHRVRNRKTGCGDNGAPSLSQGRYAHRPPARTTQTQHKPVPSSHGPAPFLPRFSWHGPRRRGRTDQAEAEFLALLRKGHVPRPQVNAVVRGLEVDFFWPDRGIVVEVDGFAHHAHRSAFENDRRRDGILAAENLSVIRFTWRQIHKEREQVLVRLAMALGARAPGPDRRGGAEPGAMRPGSPCGSPNDAAIDSQKGRDAVQRTRLRSLPSRPSDSLRTPVTANAVTIPRVLVVSIR